MDFVKQLDLSRLPRCGQQWEQMHPVPGGRLCGQCDRVIVDFRKKTPGEIAEQMLFADQPVCGVYTPEQLAAPVRESVAERRSGFPPLVAATVALLSMQSLQAVPLAQSEPVVQTEPSFKPVIPSDTLGTDSTAQITRVIRGRVFEQETGEPVPFATVKVVDHPIGASSDFDGLFTIDVSQLNDSITHVDLECRYVGYSPVVVTKVAINTDSVVEISLSSADAQVIAFGVTIGEPPKPTLWQRITRPFRRKK